MLLQTCMDGLLEAGTIIEDSFGPIMFIIHLTMCTLGTAAAQVLMQPVPMAIGGPGAWACNACIYL